MTNWVRIVPGAAWLLGLAIMLATLSHADWTRWLEGVSWRRILSRLSYRWSIDGGMLLVCLGLLGNGQHLVEQALWALLGGAFVLDAVLAWRKRRIGPRHP